MTQQEIVGKFLFHWYLNVSNVSRPGDYLLQCLLSFPTHFFIFNLFFGLRTSGGCYVAVLFARVSPFNWQTSYDSVLTKDTGVIQSLPIVVVCISRSSFCVHCEFDLP